MKIDLEDGFVRVSVALLHAWALLKLSDCSKSCLMLLVADTWGVTTGKSECVSSLKRYSLAKKLKHTFSCSAVYSAVEKLVSERVVFVNDDGLIGIELEVFTGRGSDFQQLVENLNRSRRKLNDAKNHSGIQECHAGKPEIPSPDYSGTQEEYCGGQEISAQNYSSSQEKCSGKPEVPAPNCSGQQEHTSSQLEQQSKDAHEMNVVDGDETSSVVTNEIARANLPDLLKVFVPFVASKTLRSDDGVLADVKAVHTTAAKLFHALALVYRAVDDGAFPRNLQATIADASRNPRNWPAQDPLQLLKQLDDQRKRKDYHEHIRIARDKAFMERRQTELRQKREQDRLALEKRKADSAKHHAEFAEDTKEDQSEATNHEAET